MFAVHTEYVLWFTIPDDDTLARNVLVHTSKYKYALAAQDSRRISLPYLLMGVIVSLFFIIRFQSQLF